MTIKIGSGDQFFPNIWANTITKTGGSATLYAAMPLCIVPGPNNNVFAVLRTAGTTWSNTQSRVLVYEFDTQTGELLNAVTVGETSDSADFGNTADANCFKPACINNSNNLTIVGRKSGTNALVVDLNSSLMKNREVNTGTNMPHAIVTSNSNNDIMVVYNDSNYVEILDSSSSWAATVDGGTFNGIDHVQDITADGANFFVAGAVQVGAVDWACIEKYDGTGASTASIRWYDPAYASSNDKHTADAIVVDSSGNIYVAWWTTDASALQYTSYVTKFNSSLTHQWTKRIGDLGSFHGRPTICMAPDETGVITCWHNGSSLRINQLGVAAGAEEVDLVLSSTGNSSRGNLQFGMIASDSSNVYLGFVSPSAVALQCISVMAIPQSDFESWTTEQYGEFDGDGTYGWGNTSVTPTTASLSSTGIGGTGGTPSATTTLDVDDETVAEDKDTY